MKKTLISLALVAALSGCNQAVVTDPDDITYEVQHDGTVAERSDAARENVFYRGNTYDINDPALKGKRVEYAAGVYNAYDEFLSLPQMQHVYINANYSNILAQLKVFDGLEITSETDHKVTIREWDDDRPTGLSLEIEHKNNKITGLTAINMNYDVDECMDYLSSSYSESLDAIGMNFFQEDMIDKSSGFDKAFIYPVYHKRKPIALITGICTDNNAAFKITK